MKHLFPLLLLTLSLSQYPLSLTAQIKILNEDKLVFSPNLPTAGPNPNQLFGGSLSETLDAAFDSVMALTTVKGINAALLLPDGSYWKRAGGKATQQPLATNLSTSHLMGMGSITKTFVAVTILQMQEEGLLSLDDTLGQYLPLYPNINPSATIRQLLSHRTGFNDYLNENPGMITALYANLDSIWIQDTILSNYILAPNFDLDAGWSYSNTNYMLAGEVIEAISGQAWHLTVRQRVIDPLGLTHTFAYPWETPDGQPFSHAFTNLDNFPGVDDWQGYGLPDQGLFSLAGSAGCLISNPEDLTRFCERIFSGNFLQPASLAAMQTDYKMDGSGYRYGLGALSFDNTFGLEIWGHNGSLLYQSITLYFPTENFAIALQQNDARLHNPSDPASPDNDIYSMMGALLEAYLNYSPMVSAPEASATPGLITVFPNPVEQSFRLDMPEKLQARLPLPCTISDAQGRQVMSQQLDSPADAIYIERLPAGLYTLQLGGHVVKIVKR